MQRLGIISTAVLFLLLTTTVAAYAQHDERKEQHAQPAPQHQPAQAQHKTPVHTTVPHQAYGGVYHGGVKPTGPTHGGVHYSGVPQHAGQVHDGFQQSRAKSWAADHRTWAQRGGYNGYRIPEDRFHLYFGPDHYFRMSGLPLVFVGGNPRFQYDGYWITFVDPWPDTWPDNWYQTDDVYVDYTDDGYYLYNRSRPGVAIAVTASF